MSRTACLSEVHVEGSASIWVLGQVAGPRRTGVVLYSDPDAVYLDVQGACLAVLSARGPRFPCGVRTLLPALPETKTGAEAAVHDGTIELAGCQVRVNSIVDTTVPVLSPQVARSGGLALAELVDGRLDAVRAQLPAGALRSLAAAEPTSVAGMLGLGGGLTPLGDNVLAGWLATAVASRHPGLPGIRSAVALSAHDGTTVLSATLLACAARGEGLPEFRSLLSAIATENPTVVAESVEVLLHVDDRSGAGLLLGALLALQGSAGDQAT